MKKLILICCVLFCNISISQNVIEIPKFQSIESHIETSIHIVKSEKHKIEISNNQKLNEFIKWEVVNDRLKLTDIKNLDLKDIQLTIYTPRIKELIIAKKVSISMDTKFSTINTLSVFAENGANVDLSNIVFNTLIIYKDSESNISYKSVNTLINNKKPYKY